MEFIKYALVILFNLFIMAILGIIFYATYDWLWVAHPVVVNPEPVPRDYYKELGFQFGQWYSFYSYKIIIGSWVSLILYWLLSILLWQATAYIGYPLWYKFGFGLEMHSYQQQLQELVTLWLTRICIVISYTISFVGVVSVILDFLVK